MGKEKKKQLVVTGSREATPQLHTEQTSEMGVFNTTEDNAKKTRRKFRLFKGLRQKFKLCLSCFSSVLRTEMSPWSTLLFLRKLAQE